MNNAEVIKGINMVIEGLESVREALVEVSKVDAPAAKDSKKKENVKKENSAAETGGETYTVEQLSGMKYNEFKKLASAIGVDCKGTRDQIMSRLVEAGVVEDGGDDEEDAPAPKGKSASGSKSNKPAKVEKTKSAKSTGKSSDDSGDVFDKQAEEVIASNSVEDIISALADVGVKANKLNYKKQLVAALRDGKLEADSDEEDEDSDDDGEDITADSHFEGYDLSEVNNPASMSAERAEACQALQEDILSKVESGELTSDEIVEFLQTVASQEELDLLGDDPDEESLLMLYIEVSKHFVDDDGELLEPGEPYNVNETPFCCGHALAYDKKKKKYLCEQCASEYESED